MESFHAQAAISRIAQMIQISSGILQKQLPNSALPVISMGRRGRSRANLEVCFKARLKPCPTKIESSNRSFGVNIFSLCHSRLSEIFLSPSLAKRGKGRFYGE